MTLLLQLIDYGAKGTFRQLIHMFRMYKEEVRITTPPFADSFSPGYNANVPSELYVLRPTCAALRPLICRRSSVADAGRIRQAPNPPLVAVHGKAGGAGAGPALDEPGRIGVAVVAHSPLPGGGIHAGIVVEAVVHLHRRGDRGRRCAGARTCARWSWYW